MNPFWIVDAFERQVAEFAGAKYAVATDTCTSALLLSMRLAWSKEPAVTTVVLPAQTFISVPMMAMQLGLEIEFRDIDWKGTYEIEPLGVVDGALRFQRGMYRGGLHCLSFHSRKSLPIGRGGMVLTDDHDAYHWLRAARYCGRKAPDFRNEDVEMLGFLCYMHPQEAARGLELMQWIGDGKPDQEVSYTDLRTVKLFQRQRERA